MNFRRNLGDAFSAFQKARSTLSKVHVEVIIAATLLPTSAKFGAAFSAFQKTRAALSNGAASALLRVVQKAKGRRSEIERAPAQKSKRRRSDIEETFVDKGKRIVPPLDIISIYVDLRLLWQGKPEENAQLSLTSEGALPAKPFEILNSFFFPKDDTRCLEYR